MNSFKSICLVMAFTACAVSAQTSTEMNLSQSTVALADLEEPKPVNLFINPLAYLYGAFNVNADIAVANSISIGPSAFMVDSQAVQDSIIYDNSFYGLGLRVNYFLGNHPTSNTWYMGLAPYMVYSEENMGGVLGLGSAGGFGVALGGSTGYQFAMNNLTIRMGVGYSVISPIADLSIGFRF